MSYRDMLKKKKKDLVKRHEESYKRKDGMQFGTIFQNVPEGLPFWKCGEARHEIDVIPWVAGDNVPMVAPGEACYVLDLWVHQRVGATNDPYVCPSKNFKKPCPMCEYLEDQRQKGIRLSKEEYSQVAAKRRTIYLVWVHDDVTQEDKGIQLWEISHFFFEMNVAEIAKEAPEDGGMNIWTDLDDGKSVMFTRKGSGKDNTKYFGHKFVDRRKVIPDNLLEPFKDFRMDDIINMHPSYDEIKQAFYGGEDEGSDAAAEEQELQESQQTQDASDTCPHGAQFGEEFNQYEQCDDCPVWDNCKVEFDRTHEPAPQTLVKKEETKAQPLKRRPR